MKRINSARNIMPNPDQRMSGSGDTPPSVAKKPVEIPLNLKGRPSEKLEEELTENPGYLDPEINRREIARRKEVLEAIKQGELDREAKKRKDFEILHSGLSSDGKAQFPASQKDAMQMVVEHIQGGKGIEGLLPEENFVLTKLQQSYKEFKQKNPNQPFAFKLGRDIDQKVFDNLQYNLAFKALGDKSVASAQERADEVRAKIGIPVQKVEADPMQAEKERGKQIENVLGSMAGGIGEAAKAKIREYDERIRAALAGKPLRKGDAANVLMEDFKSLAKQDWTEEFTVGKSEKPKEAQKETVGAQNNNKEYKGLSLAERKKLDNWSASYELAKIAKQQGIDLSSVSREEYVDFAIKNSLPIDDDQLRAAPWQRMATSIGELSKEIKTRRSKITKEIDMAFHNFAEEMKKKAGEQDRFIGKGIRVRQGTGTSNSWLFFGINESADRSAEKTYKAYVSLKDLNTLSPERVVLFLEALRDVGYNGDVKTFQDLEDQGVVLNDQIVMHGRTEADAKLALKVAESFFKNDLEQKSMGKDEVVGGVEKSYSQILSAKIKKELGV